MYDLTITGGTVVDGTGDKPVKADIGIKDGKIVEVRRRDGDDRRLAGRGRADHRRHRTDRHTRVRRHPHPLRRAGQLGRPARAVEHARGDHRDRRQLRGGLRPGAARPRAVADRTHGRRRGHPGHRAVRRHHLGLGELPGVPRCHRKAVARNRFRHPDRPRRGARVRDGRPRRPQRAGHLRRHRRDGPHRAGGHRSGRARVLDVADRGPPRHRRRTGARHLCRRRRAVRARAGHGRRRSGRLRGRPGRHRGRKPRRPDEGTGLDGPAGRRDRPPAVVRDGADAVRAGSVAQAARHRGAGLRRRNPASTRSSRPGPSACCSAFPATTPSPTDRPSGG